MAKKKIETESVVGENVEIANAGVVVDERITTTLKENYMPYAMSVIVSRALPEIDGLKPAHRKLLYTMYTMGLLGGDLTKSANVVGQTMKLNPHGDAAIYETMVRMSRGNETLLHPYVESKGNFGKCYSRDTMYAAARYTEVKLADIAGELFSEIKSDAVEFVPNYDNKTTEPTLLPATFPTILCNPNLGIAVGMASNICPFNLVEVCETTAKLLRDKNHDILSTIKGPDFSTGGIYLYDRDELQRIVDTGSGSLRVRAKYVYDPKDHCLEIVEIPPTTTVEEIIDKITVLIKKGGLKEISGLRDETDKKGLRLTIDVKRGNDPDRLMLKLFKQTKLEDTFSCNFNVLIDGSPRQIGIRELIFEWVRFRRSCIVRKSNFELNGKLNRLHLLEGLSKILVDIDKAVKIVRETTAEREVVPNLMIGFGIDEIQAEYIAEIKLRHLNREYVIERVSEIESLNSQIASLRELLDSEPLIDKLIISQQAEIAKKYVKPRKTRILYDVVEAVEEPEDTVADYPVNLFYTTEGYFKKITPLSLRMSGEQKLKEGDRVVYTCETKNDVNLIFFTNLAHAYKCRACDFDDTKASVLGDYVPSKLDMEEGEQCVGLVVTSDYAGYLIAFYENGKVSRVPLELFKTVKNRRMLQNAFSLKSPLVHIVGIDSDREFALIASNNRMLYVNSAFVPLKQTKDTIGVNVMSLKKGATLDTVTFSDSLTVESAHRYRTRTIPAAGAIIKDGDMAGQQSLL